MNNGYVEIHSPNHPNKMSNNCVYEHILVMEQKLQMARSCNKYYRKHRSWKEHRETQYKSK